MTTLSIHQKIIKIIENHIHVYLWTTVISQDDYFWKQHEIFDGCPTIFLSIQAVDEQIWLLNGLKKSLSFQVRISIQVQ